MASSARFDASHHQGASGIASSAAAATATPATALGGGSNTAGARDGVLFANKPKGSRPSHTTQLQPPEFAISSSGGASKRQLFGQQSSPQQQAVVPLSGAFGVTSSAAPLSTSNSVTKSQIAKDGTFVSWLDIEWTKQSTYNQQKHPHQNVTRALTDNPSMVFSTQNGIADNAPGYEKSQVAAHLFTSSEEEDERCRSARQGFVARPVCEGDDVEDEEGDEEEEGDFDEGDPLAFGDSDFEPAEQSLVMHRHQQHYSIYNRDQDFLGASNSSAAALDFVADIPTTLTHSIEEKLESEGHLTGGSAANPHAHTPVVGTSIGQQYYVPPSYAVTTAVDGLGSALLQECSPPSRTGFSDSGTDRHQKSQRAQKNKQSDDKRREKLTFVAAAKRQTVIQFDKPQNMYQVPNDYSQNFAGGETEFFNNDRNQTQARGAAQSSSIQRGAAPLGLGQNRGQFRDSDQSNGDEYEYTEDEHHQQLQQIYEDRDGSYDPDEEAHRLSQMEQKNPRNLHNASQYSDQQMYPPQYLTQTSHDKGFQPQKRYVMGPNDVRDYPHGKPPMRRFARGTYQSKQQQRFAYQGEHHKNVEQVNASDSSEERGQFNCIEDSTNSYTAQLQAQKYGYAYQVRAESASGEGTGVYTWASEEEECEFLLGSDSGFYNSGAIGAEGNSEWGDPRELEHYKTPNITIVEGYEHQNQERALQDEPANQISRSTYWQSHWRQTQATKELIKMRINQQKSLSQTLDTTEDDEGTELKPINSKSRTSQHQQKQLVQQQLNQSNLSSQQQQIHQQYSLQRSQPRCNSRSSQEDEEMGRMNASSKPPVNTVTKRAQVRGHPSSLYKSTGVGYSPDGPSAMATLNQSDQSYFMDQMTPGQRESFQNKNVVAGGPNSAQKGIQNKNISDCGQFSSSVAKMNTMSGELGHQTSGGSGLVPSGTSAVVNVNVGDMRGEADPYIELQSQPTRSNTEAGKNEQQLHRAQELGPQSMLYPVKELPKDFQQKQKTSTTNSAKDKKKKKKDQAPTCNLLLQGPLAIFLEQRSFFRNQESDPAVELKRDGSVAALKLWFESLSVQDRVNSLTTSYPPLVRSIINAYRHIPKLGPLSIFCLKKDKSAEDLASIIPQSQRRSGGVNKGGNGAFAASVSSAAAELQDLCVFEHVSNSREEASGYSPYMHGGLVRENLASLIKNTRIASNKAENDTLTVAHEIVKSTQTFFDLMANVSDDQAFAEPIFFCAAKGAHSSGRPLVESPKWCNRSSHQYLGVWIAVILEETLWAHFNFSNGVNIATGVRKNELNNLFELRSENLQSQDDLARRWTELENKGQLKLLDELKEQAKTKSIEQFQEIFEAEDRRQIQQTIYANSHHGYSSDEIYNIQYHQRAAAAHHAAAAQVAAAAATGASHATGMSGHLIHNACTSYYDYQAVQVRPHHGGLHHSGLDLLRSDGDSAFSRQLYGEDRDLKDICDSRDYLDPLTFIKFLTELPLQEINNKSYVRRHFLQRHLHMLIQENLRQSIQDALMNELMLSDAKDHKGDDAEGGGGNNDKKKKKKKNNNVDVKKKQQHQNKQTSQQQQQLLTSQNTVAKRKDLFSDSEDVLTGGAGGGSANTTAGAATTSDDNSSAPLTHKALSTSALAVTKAPPSSSQMTSEQLSSAVSRQSPVADKKVQQATFLESKGTLPTASAPSLQPQPQTLSQVSNGSPAITTSHSAPQVPKKRRKSQQQSQSASTPAQPCIDSASLVPQEAAEQVNCQQSWAFLRHLVQDTLVNIVFDRLASKEELRREQELASEIEALISNNGTDKHRANEGAETQAYLQQTSPPQQTDQQLEFAQAQLSKEDNPLSNPDNQNSLAPAQSSKLQKDQLAVNVNPVPASSASNPPPTTKHRKRKRNNGQKQAQEEKLNNFIRRQNGTLDDNDNSNSQPTSSGTGGGSSVLASSGNNNSNARNRKPQQQMGGGSGQNHGGVAGIQSQSKQGPQQQRGANATRHSPKAATAVRGTGVDHHHSSSYRIYNKDGSGNQTGLSVGNLSNKQPHDKNNNQRRQQQRTDTPKHEVKQLSRTGDVKSSSVGSAYQQIATSQPSSSFQFGVQPASSESQQRSVVQEKECPQQASYSFAEDQTPQPCIAAPSSSIQLSEEIPSLPQESTVALKPLCLADEQPHEEVKQSASIKVQINVGDQIPASPIRKKQQQRTASSSFNPSQELFVPSAQSNTPGASSRSEDPSAHQVFTPSDQADRATDFDKKPSETRRNDAQTQNFIGLTKDADHFNSQAVKANQETHLASEFTKQNFEPAQKYVAQEQSTEILVKKSTEDTPALSASDRLSGNNLTDQSLLEAMTDGEDDASLVQQKLMGTKIVWPDASTAQRQVSLMSTTSNSFTPSPAALQQITGCSNAETTADAPTLTYTPHSTPPPAHFQVTSQKFNPVQNPTTLNQSQLTQAQNSSTSPHLSHANSKAVLSSGTTAPRQQQSFQHQFYEQNPAAVGSTGYTRQYSNRTKQVYSGVGQERQEMFPAKLQNYDESQPHSPQTVYQAVAQPVTPVRKINSSSSTYQGGARGPISPGGAYEIGFTYSGEGVAQHSTSQKQQIGVDFHPGTAGPAQQSYPHKKQQTPFRPGQQVPQQHQQIQNTSSSASSSQGGTGTGQQQQFYQQRSSPSSQNQLRQQFSEGGISFGSNESSSTTRKLQLGSTALNTQTQNHQHQFNARFQQPMTRVQSHASDQPHQLDYRPQQQSQQPRSRPQSPPELTQQQSNISLNAPSFNPNQQLTTANFASSSGRTRSDWDPWIETTATEQILYQQQQQILAPVSPEQDPLFLALEDRFYQKFDSNIAAQTKNVQQRIELYEEERDFVVKRVQGLTELAFPGRSPVVKVYGSLMTGLALAESDMDMAVTGLSIGDRESMVEDLRSLAAQLETWNLVRDLKAIDTASIPVIKAQVGFIGIAREMGKAIAENQEAEVFLPIDITFDDSPNEGVPSTQQSQLQGILQQHPQHQQLYHPHHHVMPQQAQIPQHGGFEFGHIPGLAGFPAPLQSIIAGDFGFGFPQHSDPLMGGGFGLNDFGGPQQQKCHLGLASCNLLKEYVRTYPCLQDVSLLLKRFLSVNELNIPYQGGISSYSTVLLIVAYMNNFNLQKSPHLTPSRLLMGFLDFYSNCFEPKFFGVNTSNGMSFYQLPQINQQMFVIVDPINPTNNTARNSFRTPDVLQSFRAAFRSLKSLISKQYSLVRSATVASASHHSLQSPWGHVSATLAQQQLNKKDGPQSIGGQGGTSSVSSLTNQSQKEGETTVGEGLRKKKQQQEQSHSPTVPCSSTLQEQQFLPQLPGSTGPPDFTLQSASGVNQTQDASQQSLSSDGGVFDQLNFVDEFLSLEILSSAADEQADGIAARSGFGAF